MKIYHYASIAILMAILAVSPCATHAQLLIDTGAAMGVGESLDAEHDKEAVNLRDTLKARIQENVQTYQDNLRNNEDYRNAMLENRVNTGSTTHPLPPRPAFSSTSRAEAEGREGSTARRFVPPAFMKLDATSTRDGGRDDRDASTTHGQEIRREVFVVLQNRLVHDLSTALGNLRQIRARISARIAAETQSGNNMTEASSLLVTADAKITLAQNTIDALSSFSPEASSSATTSVDLGHPRQLATDAIKAVNDARTALQRVVLAIAKTLGAPLHDNEHSTTTVEVQSTEAHN